MANVDIKYLNKDYTDFKAALIEYAKAYYPTVYNDFTTASPGSMFIEMASYVGDVLSFYLDNQIQETFLQYAKQPSNVYALAYMLGYKPKLTSAATVDLDVYQLLPSKENSPGSGVYVPDYDYSLTIEDGMQINGNTGLTTNFYVPQSINFTVSSSTSPTEVTVYSTDGFGNPQYYLLKKTTQALSGTLKTATFTFTEPVKFSTVTITDSDVIQVISVVDSDNNTWYEVPYLAQDTILESVANLEGAVPEYRNDTEQVPYFLQVRKVPRRFVSRITTDSKVELQFGPGINLVADEAVIPNPNKAGIGLLDGLTKLNTAYDPTNFTTTYTYGLAPSNTTLTVTYLVGGGASANVPANSLNSITTLNSNFYVGVPTDNNLAQIIQNSVSVNNPLPAAGGGDGDTVEEIKLNTLLQYPTQLRAVTQQDYIAHAYSMPSQFGKIAKAYITKDSAVFKNILQEQPGVIDPYTATIYVLGYDADGNLDQPLLSLKENLKTYLTQYRMLTDTIYIRDAFIVNIGVNFEVVLRPNYAGREVIAEAITKLKAYFDIQRWEINQPLILSDIYNVIDQVQGVQTVRNVEIVNKYEGDYSPYAYDISSATLNGVVYPSLDPSIFEVKFPDRDIKGKVVTF